MHIKNIEHFVLKEKISQFLQKILFYIFQYGFVFIKLRFLQLKKTIDNFK